MIDFITTHTLDTDDPIFDRTSHTLGLELTDGKVENLAGEYCIKIIAHFPQWMRVKVRFPGFTRQEAG